MNSIFFNAHHSPIGAFASFTLGFPGASGGFDLELGRPPRQNIYIGLETEDGHYEALPFFAGGDDESKRYDVEQASGAQPAESAAGPQVASISKDRIKRDFRLSTDTWEAGDLTFRLYSPVQSIPDPAICRCGGAEAGAGAVHYGRADC